MPTWISFQEMHVALTDRPAHGAIMEQTSIMYMLFVLKSRINHFTSAAVTAHFTYKNVSIYML